VNVELGVVVPHECRMVPERDRCCDQGAGECDQNAGDKEGGCLRMITLSG
jgi:hypothetical protein